MTHIETIESFYRAFAQRDYAGMTACYNPSIHFSDPLFPDLHGGEVPAMWHMLCEQGTDLAVAFTDVAVDGNHGNAHWEATYTFSPTGRAIHNRIEAAFEFGDDTIIRHVDTFDLWRWTRMALGSTGIVTGWTEFTQAKVRATADKGLRRFMSAHPEYARPEGQ